MVSTLCTMTPIKQQRVLTLLKAKLAAHQDTLPLDSLLTHPLHEWLLPADDPQFAPCPIHNTLPEQILSGLMIHLGYLN